MGLESGTLITDLNASWPLGSDPVSQGDDHIKLIKSVLQSALPGNSAPLQFTGYDMHIINDQGGTGLGGDLFVRDIDCETINVYREIQANPQVCIALGIIDGTTATFQDNNFGCVGVTRTAGQAKGSYDVTITETPGDDTVGGGSAFYGILGGYSVSVIKLSGSTIRVQTYLNGGLEDAENLNFFVLDSGRG